MRLVKYRETKSVVRAVVGFPISALSCNYHTLLLKVEALVLLGEGSRVLSQIPWIRIPFDVL